MKKSQYSLKISQIYIKVVSPSPCFYGYEYGKDIGTVFNKDDL